MIRKLRLQNFMCAKDATIDFGKITIFTGPTDNGKSTILRAIAALVTNRFPASKYSTHGTQKYAITLINDSGAISLIKSKVSQYQTIDIATREKTEFNAVGKDVPEEVQERLNMPFLKIGDEHILDVLYQSQHNPFFLINEDRSTFSRVIALISNADRLRKLESAVNSELLIVKRKITQIKDVISAYDGSIATQEVFYNDVKHYTDVDAQSESLLKEASEIEAKLSQLRKILKLKEELRLLEQILSLPALNVNNVEHLIRKNTLRKMLENQSKEVFRILPEKLVIPELKQTSVQKLKANYSFAFKHIPPKQNFPELILTKLSVLKANLHASFLILPDKLRIPQSEKINNLSLNLQSFEKFNSEQKNSEESLSLIHKELEEFNGQPCPLCGHLMNFEV